MEPLILHYAPDNASLCVRLALEELKLPFATRLVDRSTQAQRRPAYLALNPNGLIPVLETPDGPMFETAAILLWLAQQNGRLFPAISDPVHGQALSWLFWLANTLHPALQARFHPEKYPFCTPQIARAGLTARLDLAEAHLPALMDKIGYSILDCYFNPMFRWATLYPAKDKGWLDGETWPGLYATATRAESHASVHRAAAAEGLGPAPFSAPEHPTPPTGSAT